MHQPPTYTCWKINCDSPSEAQALREWLSSRIELARVLTDTIRVSPDGVDHAHVEQHRLGDYFANIHTHWDIATNPESFRLIFQKRPMAARFWKDLMVDILKEIETAPQKATIKLDSKGETDPTTTPPRYLLK